MTWGDQLRLFFAVYLKIFKKVYMKRISCVLIFCFVLLYCLCARADDGGHAIAPKPEDPSGSAITAQQSPVPTEKSNNNNDLAEGQVALKNAIDGSAETHYTLSNPLPSEESNNNNNLPEEQAGIKDAIDDPAKTLGTLADNLPSELKQYAGEASNKFKEKGLNYLDVNVTAVKYNEDGTISSVTLDDWTTISYSYERYGNGELASCSLRTDDGTNIVFSNRSDKSNLSWNEAYDMQNGAADGGRKMFIEIYVNDIKQGNAKGPAQSSAPGSEPHARAKPTLVYSGKTNISPEEMARTPVKFDFKNINIAIAKAEGIKKGALKNYEKNSENYYSEVEKALVKSGFLSNDKSGMSEQGRREGIDKGVADACSASLNGNGSEVLRELIVKEKVLRGKILTALAEYDSRIREAQGNIDDMVDKLINSKLAVYLNAKKDKVDAIVKLPKIEKER